MKRITLFALAVIAFSAFTYGQKKPKPKLSKIENMFKAGDYAGAQNMVADAETYEKTKDNPKTYYLKGLIYAAIDTAGLTLAENARETAIASFAKYEELEDPDKEETYIGNNGIFTYSQLKNQYYGFYFNKAAQFYDQEDFASAAENFGYASNIIPDDTTAYLYGGYAASNGKDYETAKGNYEKLIEMGINSSDVYTLLVFIYGNVDNDYEKALSLTRAAIEKFPKNNELRRSEIQMLIQMDQVEEARTNLIEAIEKEPNDPSLTFSLGVMYDNLSEATEDEIEKKELLDKAYDAYSKAIEVDDTYTNAYYNIGVMLIGRANEVIKESNNLGYSKADLKKAEELQPIINQRLKDALPIWERVNELDPNQNNTLETLQYLYVQLKMMDEAEAVTNQLDELKAGN